MFRKTVVIILLVVACCRAVVWANDCNDYIIPGRALMFDRTLSGLRQAYQTFDAGINDPCCADNRELKFLHAVTGTAMLVIRNDGNSIDSVLELAKEFDIELLGDSIDPMELEIFYPLNQHDAYEIPDGAPDAKEVADIIDTSIIPEVNDIIAELNSISDSNDDRFRIFFGPNETGLENDLEVDYGEVLILKGLLMALKNQLQAKQAYDMYTDPNDMLIEKVYGDSFNINSDLNEPYPDFLKVLPTANDSNDGAAVLAQARQNWIDAINYYLDAIAYIRSEEDPQEDDLLYIDPNDDDLVDGTDDKLSTLRDSLIDDTVITTALETIKMYILEDANSTSTWELELEFDFLDLGDWGSFVLVDDHDLPSPWEIYEFTIEDNELIAEMDYDGPAWGGAVLTATISEDHNNITNGTFEYWGFDNGTVYGLSGEVVDTEVEDVNFDLNPVFASSPDVNNPRYVQPVNPRDLLPVFDEWNGPQPNSVGHGLGDDATLGGIAPDMNQYDWQLLRDLQPGGLFELDFIGPGQVVIDGNTGDWSPDQLVFEDIRGDTEEGPNTVSGADINSLYMAYDWENIYGALTFYDNIGNPIYYQHYISLSYLPDDDSAFGTIILNISIFDGSALGSLYYLDSSPCFPTWHFVTDFDAIAGPNAVEFKVQLEDIPADLAGRFISVDASGWDSTSYEWDDEQNETHLQIGNVGTISGTVSYGDYIGAPIFVQAYTDPWEPEESLVASTMITEPGPYTLEGIGLRWRGYVRAFTPLFGFNVFDMDALTIQASVPVFLMGPTLDDVDIVLMNPVALEKDAWVAGEIDPEYEEDWYAFDANESDTYTLELNRGTADYACMTLYGRDGHSELQETFYWQTQRIFWTCEVSGRYYVKVANWYCQPDGGTYQIYMAQCPRADIASAAGVGVKDCKVDSYDLAVLISHWLNSCFEPYWCDGSDFDKSGLINFADFAVVADEWLNEGLP